jgi:magnesium transporter
MKAYTLSGETIQEIDFAHSDFINDNNYFIIINPSDIEQVVSKFNLVECITDNCLERRQHTGIEAFKDHYCIKLDIPQINEGRVVVQQLDMYFGKNFLICLANEEINLILNVEKEVEHNASVAFKGIINPVNKLLYMILDRLVLKGLGVIAELERKIEAQEERVLKVGRRNMVNELIFLRRQVFKIRRYLNPLTYIGDMLLLNELEIIDYTMIKYFSNIDIKFSQLNNDASELCHLISNLREAYESEISNQLNEIMKVFTIISTIFLPLTLVSGIYGMNFENMPELRLKYGYFLVLGLMVFIVGGLILIFRKKKWL